MGDRAVVNMWNELSADVKKSPVEEPDANFDRRWKGGYCISSATRTVL